MPSTDRPLRRTVRRCTAALVAAVGVAAWSLVRGTEAPAWILVLGALLYLGGSFVSVPEWEVEDADAE